MTKFCDYSRRITHQDVFVFLLHSRQWHSPRFLPCTSTRYPTRQRSVQLSAVDRSYNTREMTKLSPCIWPIKTKCLEFSVPCEPADARRRRCNRSASTLSGLNGKTGPSGGLLDAHVLQSKSFRGRHRTLKSAVYRMLSGTRATIRPILRVPPDMVSHALQLKSASITWVGEQCAMHHAPCVSMWARFVQWNKEKPDSSTESMTTSRTPDNCANKELHGVKVSRVHAQDWGQALQNNLVYAQVWRPVHKNNFQKKWKSISKWSWSLKLKVLITDVMIVTKASMVMMSTAQQRQECEYLSQLSQ